jgi:hypothetical protein
MIGGDGEGHWECGTAAPLQSFRATSTVRALSSGRINAVSPTALRRAGKRSRVGKSPAKSLAVDSIDIEIRPTGGGGGGEGGGGDRRPVTCYKNKSSGRSRG